MAGRNKTSVKMIDSLKSRLAPIKAWITNNHDNLFIAGFAGVFFVLGFVSGALIF